MRWPGAAAVLGSAGTPASASGSTSAPPGTPPQPVLSAPEAAPLVPANYLETSGLYEAPTVDPWRPRPVETRRPDHMGGDRGLTTGPEAVDAAVTAGGTTRVIRLPDRKCQSDQNRAGLAAR